MAQQVVENFTGFATPLNAGEGEFIFEAVVAVADKLNRNRRIYSQEELNTAFSNLQFPLVRRPGTNEHPELGKRATLSDNAVLWQSWRWDGANVVAQGKIIETARGLDLKANIKAGVEVGFSTRGWAERVEERGDDGLPVYRIKNYKLETIDAVGYPSADAYVLQFTGESVSMDELKEALTRAARAEAQSIIDAGKIEALTAELGSVRNLLEAAEKRATDAEAAKVVAETAQVAAEARVAVIEAEAKQHEVKAKLASLVAEHRFGAAIQTSVEQLVELGLTLTVENVDAVVSEVSKGIESRATEEATPRGNPQSDETEAPNTDLTSMGL